MKILQVISMGYVCGGAEQSVRTLKEHLIKNGHEVKVLASDLCKDDPSTFSDYTYSHITPGTLSGYFKRLWNPDSYKGLRKAIHNFKPDVIHFHTMGELSPSAIFAVGKTPAILTVHGPEEYTKGILQWFLESNAYKSEDIRLSNLNAFGKAEYIFYRWLQRPLYVWGIRKKISCIVSPSLYLAKELENEKYGVKIVQFYNGLELPRQQKMPVENVILFVGRLSHVKGASFLIAAMPELLKSFPAAQLNIIGEGPAREQLEKQVAELKLQDKISFLGWQKNTEVIAQFKHANVVVIPSIWPENLPTVAIEAMAVGRPIIGTQVGGIPELVTHGKNGLLVPPSDSSAITHALLELFSDTQQSNHMARASREHSKKFTVSLFMKQIEFIYKETIAK